MLSSLQETLTNMLSTFHNLSTNEAIPSIAPPHHTPSPPPPPDDIESEPLFMNIEDARKSLAHTTWDRMTTHYKRTPTQDTDILFSCCRHSSVGVWWIPLDHPIADVLIDSKDFAMEDIYRTDLGNVVIFSELAVATCVRAIASMCRENGFPLLESITEEDIKILEQFEESSDEYEDEYDDEEEEEEQLSEVIVDNNQKNA